MIWGRRTLAGDHEDVLAQRRLWAWPAGPAGSPEPEAGRSPRPDLPDAGLRADWRRCQGLGHLHANADELPFADDQFDVVVAAEVLEHLPDPVRGLAEMARVGRRHMVVSVSREPIFRGCSFLAGHYVGALGNTRASEPLVLARLRAADVAGRRGPPGVTNPFLWTTVWATLPGAERG